MTDEDDLDELLAQPGAVTTIITAPEADEAIRALEPRLAELVAGFAQGRIRMTDAQQRAQLVALRESARAAQEPLRLIADTIEKVFLTYAVEAGAKEVPIPGAGPVRYEAPRGEYVADWRALRSALIQANLDTGAPTLAEIEQAFSEEVIVKGNNTRLNGLATRYGGEVAEAIRAHRQYVAPGPEKGRVRFPA
jgi:hypothetical protein